LKISDVGHPPHAVNGNHFIIVLLDVFADDHRQDIAEEILPEHGRHLLHVFPVFFQIYPF
jgi:hypothetical protein